MTTKCNPQPTLQGTRLQRRPRHLAASCLLFLLIAAMFTAPAAAQETGGPTQILITFRCAAADRPAFRTYLQSEESHMLEKLKAEGVLRATTFSSIPSSPPARGTR